MIKTNTSTYKIGEKVDIGGQEAYAIDVTIQKWELKFELSPTNARCFVPVNFSKAYSAVNQTNARDSSKPAWSPVRSIDWLGEVSNSQFKTWP